MAGFPEVNFLSPQGDFSYLQCSLPCSNDIYSSYEYMKRILDNINLSTMEARPEDIPHCPKCGRRMIPNVRSDDRFVEDSHIFNYVGYNQFIEKNSKQKKVLLLELGVGYSTPSIIRYPFENLVKFHKNWTLIRINKDYFDLPKDKNIDGRIFAINYDISNVISRLVVDLLDDNKDILQNVFN